MQREFCLAWRASRDLALHRDFASLTVAADVRRLAKVVVPSQVTAQLESGASPASVVTSAATAHPASI